MMHFIVKFPISNNMVW